MKKERVDVLAVEQGLFDSREKAKRAIMAGLVHDDHDRLDKPGMKIPRDTVLSVKGEKLKYVSRGGLKLEKALKTFPIDLNGKIMIDIGSSTGGFTDCALQNGAKFVYAVDVGTNQLVWKLRNDERVKVMEQYNFRYAKKEDFDQGAIQFASIDVSFISLSHIFHALKDIIEEHGQVAALIKPQFEAGREEVGKHGIVKDPKIHDEVIKKVIGYAHEEGFSLQGLTYSPITGGEGNIEFLGYFIKSDQPDVDIDVTDVVKEAHGHF
jgi:23S rRNA (cytidine1920-2'-O)/16S rRNA (cytidine1409-2'-O)-methyltransferase